MGRWSKFADCIDPGETFAEAQRRRSITITSDPVARSLGLALISLEGSGDEKVFLSPKARQLLGIDNSEEGYTLIVKLVGMYSVRLKELNLELASIAPSLLRWLR